MAIFAKSLVAMKAFIEELGAQLIEIRNGGIIKSANWDPETRKGWKIDFEGNAFFNSGEIGGTKINATEFTVNGKGYLPVGFVYFRLKGTPEPGVIFTGTWENISSQFAGLFFRVEGGNAAAFGQDQDMSVQTFIGGSGSVIAAGFQSGFRASETRPVNSTIQIWQRRS